MGDAIMPEGSEMDIDDREAMMDKIEQDREEELKLENEAYDDNGEQLQSTQDQETSESSQEPGETEQEEAKEIFKVKMGGVESEVTLDELTSNYQKAGYAEQKLEEAARAQDQLKIDQAAWLAEREQASQEQDKESDRLSISDADKLAAAIDDLSVGSDEERVIAAENILAMVNNGRGNDNPATRIDAEAVTATVLEQTRRQMQYDNAIVKFAENYQDIESDPILKKMAYDFMVEEAETSTTYDEAFKKAGDRVNEWVSGFKPASKRALKEKLGHDPVSSGTADKPVEVVLTEEENNQLALKEIMEARGQ